MKPLGGERGGFKARGAASREEKGRPVCLLPKRRLAGGTEGAEKKPSPAKVKKKDEEKEGAGVVLGAFYLFIYILFITFVCRIVAWGRFF